MKKQFIPYELALELKELGFKNNWNFKEYDTMGYLQHTGLLESHKLEAIDAPLWQQAFRWFREKHNLEASIQRMPPEVYGKGKGDIKNYLLYIWAENLNPRGQQTLHFDTYEEAEFECLKKLIELCKNN